MGPKNAYDENLGKTFGKPDIERLGFFVDGPFGYKRQQNIKKRPLEHLATFLTSGKKTKTGTQHGYFENEFKRVFIGEAIPRFKKRSQQQNQPFIIGSRGKKHATPGDHFGTFGGVIEAFSNTSKKSKSTPTEGRNFTTKNIKKGGPGVVDICINKYPEHSKDPYKPKIKSKEFGGIIDGRFVSALYPQDYFDKNPFVQVEKFKGTIYVRPNDKGSGDRGIFRPTGPSKWQGGSHAGCFSEFPKYSACKYVSILEANKPSISSKGSIFYPVPTAPKTKFTSSIVQYNTDLRVTPDNYKSVEPMYTEFLLN